MKELSSLQVKATSLIVEGIMRRKVAEALSIAPQTLSEWNKNPLFVKTISDLKKEALNEIKENLTSSASLALETLRELAKESKNEEVRRKAALDIIELTGLKSSLPQFLS